MKINRLIQYLIIVLAATGCSQWSASDQIVEFDADLVINNEESLAYLDKLLDNDGDNEEYLYKKSELLFTINRIVEAEEVLRGIDKIEDQDWNVKLLFIRIKIKRQDYDEALKLAENMYLSSEFSIELNSLLSDLYYHKGLYLKSMDFLNRCIEIDAENSAFYFKKGLSSYGLRDTINALRNFDLALSRGFNDQDGIVLYANLLAEIGEGQRSLSLLNGYLNNTEDNFKLKMAYANGLKAEGLFSDAKNVLLLIDSSQRNSPIVYQYLSEIYFEESDYDTAIYYAGEILALDSNYLEGYYNLGRSLRIRNQIYIARNTYKTGLKRFPSDPILVEELDKLEKYIAYLQRSKKEYDERIVLPLLKPKTVDN